MIFGLRLERSMAVSVGDSREIFFTENGYYGLYSNKHWGCPRKGTGRSKAGAKNAAPWPKSSPPPPAKLPACRWRDLMRQAWHTDPVECPKRQSSG